MVLNGANPFPKELMDRYYKNHWWSGMTLGEMLDRSSDLYPQKEALVAEGVSLTYRELKDWTDRAAIAFFQLGIQKLDRILLQIPNWVEFVYAYYGLQRTDKKGKTPEGLWVKCDGCKEIIYKKEIEKNLKICPKCNYHFRISARERLKLLVDEGSFVEIDENLSSEDPLHFKDSISYKERLKENQKKSGLKEAVISGEALIKGYPISLVVLDFSFMGGSMGSVVGEKVSRAAERSIEKKQPFISIASPGGARMQEGIFSLMQMAKASASIGWWPR